MVGAGPAGLAFSCYAAERGHEVHLFESSSQIGGQFNYAKQIPGKEEFHETLRFFTHRLSDTGVKLHLNTRQSAASLLSEDFDEVVLATGVLPREIKIEGINNDKVMSYLDVLRDHKNVGAKVALIGAGGIGFDVAEYLTTRESPTLNADEWSAIWGSIKTIRSVVR